MAGEVGSSPGIGIGMVVDWPAALGRCWGWLGLAGAAVLGWCWGGGGLGGIMGPSVCGGCGLGSFGGGRGRPTVAGPSRCGRGIMGPRLEWGGMVLTTDGR